jgi:hypothetical protein
MSVTVAIIWKLLERLKRLMRLFVIGGTDRPKAGRGRGRWRARVPALQFRFLLLFRYHNRRVQVGGRFVDTEYGAAIRHDTTPPPGIAVLENEQSGYRRIRLSNSVDPGRPIRFNVVVTIAAMEPTAPNPASAAALCLTLSRAKLRMAGGPPAVSPT